MASMWAENFKNEFGVESDLSNILFFPERKSYITPIKKSFIVTTEAEVYRWLANYEPTPNRKAAYKITYITKKWWMRLHLVRLLSKSTAF